MRKKHEMKTLILYYSYGGNTKHIAEMIQKEIGGDIVRMDTVVPYDDDYSIIPPEQKENAAISRHRRQIGVTSLSAAMKKSSYVLEGFILQAITA